jgi:hypothetical protein
LNAKPLRGLSPVSFGRGERLCCFPELNAAGGIDFGSRLNGF